MKFSTTWKKSKKPRKQRLYRHNAPLSTKQKFVSVHLNKELRKKYNRRSIGLKKGDKVKILRGQFKGKEGAVEDIDLKKESVVITGIQITKKDGNKVNVGTNPSNLMINEIMEYFAVILKKSNE